MKSIFNCEYYIDGTCTYDVEDCIPCEGVCEDYNDEVSRKAEEKWCKRKMFGEPLVIIGETYYEREEYVCSNALCSNYGVIIERRITWTERLKFSRWINSLKMSVKNTVRSWYAKIVVH